MASMDESQGRATDRVPFASRVMVVHGESAWFAELLDLSETGCGIFRPEGWVLEEDELVRLFFPRDDGSAAVNVPGRVARVTPTQVGFEYHDTQTVPPSARPR
jgi:hypothetical protein